MLISNACVCSLLDIPSYDVSALDASLFPKIYVLLSVYGSYIAETKDLRLIGCVSLGQKAKVIDSDDQ